MDDGFENELLENRQKCHLHGLAKVDRYLPTRVNSLDDKAEELERQKRYFFWKWLVTIIIPLFYKSISCGREKQNE